MRMPTQFDPETLEGLSLQRRLHRHYTALLSEPEGFADTPSLSSQQEIHEVEDAWIRHLDARSAGFELPKGSAQFKDWYFTHVERHAEATASFTTYLAEQASLSEMALFFMVEEKVDSKFDDLMALAQLGTSGKVKLTIGDNYWDEMGHGNPRFVHTTMFNTSVSWMREQFRARGRTVGDIEFPEIFTNANQLLMYGLTRRHAPRLIGALGVLEQTAPQRFQSMVDGCVRLGVPKDVIAYQSLHVGVDHDHGAEWFEHVLLPLTQRGPSLMEELCRGVLTRCDVATRYYREVEARLVSGRYR